MRERTIEISAIEHYKNKYICFAKNINMLFELDIDGETRVLCMLPEDRKNRLVEKILVSGDRVFMIPLHGKCVYEFDLKQESLNIIELQQGETVKYFKFFNGFIFGECLYLIGSYYPSIVKININDRNINEIPIYESKLELQKKINDCFARKSIVVRDHKIYIPSALDNEVAIYDTDTDTYSWKKIGNDTNRFSGIAWDGESFWFSPRNCSTIVRWIPNVLIDEIDISPWYKDDKNFAGILCRDNKIYLYSLNSEYSVVYDVESKKAEKIFTGAECFFENLDGTIFNQFRDGKLFIYGDEENKIININPDGIYETISNRDDKWSYYFNESRTFDLSAIIGEVLKC